MPIEIRELIIKTTVIEKNVLEVNTKNEKISKQEIEKIKEEILNICNEKIAQALKKRKER